MDAIAVNCPEKPHDIVLYHKSSARTAYRRSGGPAHDKAR
jgi:hypothetical protein